MNQPQRFAPERIARLDAALAGILDDPAADKSGSARLHRDILADATPFDVLGLNRFADEDPAAIGRIKEEAGKLVHLLHAGLRRFAWNREVHPALVLLRRENAAILAEADALKPLYGNLADPAARAALALRVARFSCLERKFLKAELLLHPALDGFLPSPVPLKVLWSLHDDIRFIVAELGRVLGDPAAGSVALAKTVGRFHALVVGLVEKEELILYPAAATLLSVADWDAVGREAAGFGYAFGADPEPVFDRTRAVAAQGRFAVRTGALDLDQIALVFDALPVELTFVDEYGITRYFNDTREKLFLRTPQIIGRPVENCHPQKSVPVVKKLLSAFAAGAADRAELWVDVRGRFVHIVYTALRDADGRYRGALETVQDATRLRSLEGSKETLDF